jgi:peptidyl-prolyl cis-trans isomerase C
MKSHPIRPFVLTASLLTAVAVIGADTTPKKAADAAPASAPAAAPAQADQVLATVNGEEIKSSHVNAEIGKILAQRGMPPDAIPAQQRDQIVRSMLDDMIMDKLVTKAAADTKISDAEVNGEFDKIRQRRGGTDDEIKKELAGMGMTIESLKADIKDRMQKRKWVDDQIKGKVADATDADAKAFFDKNPTQFEQPEQVRASHILFRLEPNAAPDKITETMKKAEQAIQRAKKEDFAKLAGELSEEPGAKERGGDLNFFPRQGMMVEEFADAAFKLKKDEVTAEPVRTQFGYHVIKVTDRKPAEKQKFEEVKPQIVEYLGREKKNEAIQTVLTDLREKSKVEVKLPPPAPAAAIPGAPGVPVEAVTPPVTVPPAEGKK